MSARCGGDEGSGGVLTPTVRTASSASAATLARVSSRLSATTKAKDSPPTDWPMSHASSGKCAPTTPRSSETESGSDGGGGSGGGAAPPPPPLPPPLLA